jgi:hypothetical protein
MKIILSYITVQALNFLACIPLILFSYLLFRDYLLEVGIGFAALVAYASASQTLLFHRLDSLEKKKNESHAALKILESIHSEEKCNNHD